MRVCIHADIQTAKLQLFLKIQGILHRTFSTPPLNLTLFNNRPLRARTREAMRFVKVFRKRFGKQEGVFGEAEGCIQESKEGYRGCPKTFFPICLQIWEKSCTFAREIKETNGRYSIEPTGEPTGIQCLEHTGAGRAGSRPYAPRHVYRNNFLPRPSSSAVGDRG